MSVTPNRTQPIEGFSYDLRSCRGRELANITSDVTNIDIANAAIPLLNAVTFITISFFRSYAINFHVLVTTHYALPFPRTITHASAVSHAVTNTCTSPPVAHPCTVCKVAHTSTLSSVTHTGTLRPVTYTSTLNPPVIHTGTQPTTYANSCTTNTTQASEAFNSITPKNDALNLGREI